MVTVLVTDEQDDHPVETRRWATLAERVLETEGAETGTELSMVFADEATMADLNRRYAGEEGATDVLAFPMDQEPMVGGPPRLLGDLVICPAVAHRNAHRHAGTYDDELALLVVHGLLHLLGMDHLDPGEAEEMQRKERQLLHRLHAAGSPVPP
jgi:probable rRNA maturation factor